MPTISRRRGTLATIDGNEAVRPRRLPRQRGLRDLPDHAVLDDGRARRPVVGERQAEHLGRRADGRSRCRARAAPPAPLHGALQAGALTTTFTASQGLLLMIPNMYKIAGELTSAVFHVAARALADAGAVDLRRPLRRDGRARAPASRMLASASVQEAHDLRADRAAATLESRVPFVHFFDGFRTSHEVNKIALLSDDDLRALVDDELVLRAPRAGAQPRAPVHPRHRAEPRRLLPGARDREPVLRARAGHRRTRRWTRFAERDRPRATGCSNTPAHPDAERVVVLMGSGAETARETVGSLAARGETRRRAAGAAVPAVLRRSTCSRRCPRRRARSPCSTAPRSPARSASRSTWTSSPRSPRRAAGAPARRCRASSAAATACRRRSSRRRWSRRCSTSCRATAPRNRFTVGINDDVCAHEPAGRPARSTSSPTTSSARCSSASAPTARSAPTRTASRSSATTRTSTRRATSSTTRRSRARRRSRTCASGPSRSARTYLIELGAASSAATSSASSSSSTCCASPRTARRCCSTRPFGPTRSGTSCRDRCRSRSSTRRIARLRHRRRRRSRARPAWARAPTRVLQTCFFAISGVLPRDEAIDKIKTAIEKTYGAQGRRGRAEELRGGRPARSRRSFEVPVPGHGDRHAGELLPVVAGRRAGVRPRRHGADDGGPRRRAAGERAAGRRHLPERHDAVGEARHLGDSCRCWEPELCIQCGNCAFVCPHSVIRAKFYDAAALDGAPDGLPVGADRRARLPRHPLHAAGLRRGLHRLRPVRRGLPGQATATSSGTRAINLARASR